MEESRFCYNCFCKIPAGARFCTQCGFNYQDYMAKRNPKALLPGTVLHDRYLLGKVLGMGGFGVTYVGYDLNLNIKIAIKEYFPSAYASRQVTGLENHSSHLYADYDSMEYKSGLRQFLQEARTIARFNKDSGIVSVSDYFEENKTGYYVMDFLPGPSLKYMVDHRNQPMNEREVIRILKPVILALREVHKEGIVHRDISPDNMVMDDKKKLTLIDFGAAKLNNVVNESGSIQLKHGYAPLEQYSFDGNQGPWTDVYALCATIYYMMTHAKPMPANQRAIEDRLISLEQLGLASPAFSDVVMQGLAVDYKRRFKNLNALVRAFYEDRMIDTGSDGSNDWTGSDSNKGMMVAFILCLCCILVVIFLIYMMLRM